ncbi:RND family transporter [Bacteroidota bacterium]
MRERILSKWGEIATRYNGWVLLAALVVTIITIGLAGHLKLTTRWSDLLPLNDPKVQEFEDIINDFKSASNSIIVVQGEESQIKLYSDQIVPLIKQMDDVKWVEHKINEEFLANHGLMLTKANDLKDMQDLFTDLGLLSLLTSINDNFEKTYVGGSEKISTREKEDGAVAFLDGIEFWLNSMESFATGGENLSPELATEAVERLLYGDPYLISQDKRMLLVSVQPNFSITDIELVIEHVVALQEIIDKNLPDFPGISAGMTGMMPLAHDEMVYSMRDMQLTSIIAFVLVIALFILSFRMWTSPLLAGANLIIGIIWAAGFGAIFLDSLNLFTQMFAVILIGMGIDYSIHIISIYNEMRYRGENMTDAMKSTMLKSGNGIITSGLTTASAFFTLMISNSRGMKEMGLMLGIGILACMVSTILVLPSVLVTREKISSRLRRKPIKPVNVEFRFLGRLGQSISNRPVAYLIVGVVLTGIFLYQALTVTFDYNYLNMEPKGIPSVTLQDDIIDAFQMSPDFALVTTATIEESREIAEKAKEVSSISAVASISDYIPSKKQQEERLPYLVSISKDLTDYKNVVSIDENNLPALVGELERLEMNVYELSQMAYIGGQDRIDRKCKRLIGDLDDSTSTDYILKLADRFLGEPAAAARGLNAFQEYYEPVMREKALKMANVAPITLDILPHDIKSQFFNESGDRMLVTIMPKEKVWDFKFLAQFTDQLNRVSPKITGTPPMFLALIRYIGRDGKVATLLTLVVVFVLLLADFRKVSTTLITMIPLLFGAVWMVGLLKTIGQQLTLLNVMGIPMIIGIGIDFGVHFMHRYRHEGPGNIRTVMASTGKAIMITSMTTMIGFGSLLLAKYRGMGSMGLLLVLGVGACFVTTIWLLPALLGWIEKRKVQNSE